MKKLFAIFGTALALLSAGCGYHVAGTVSTLPVEIHTIAVTPWRNVSTQYRFSDYIAAAVTREFISRTRYKIVTDPAAADAVLTGAVANLQSSATVFDPVTNRAAAAQIVVQIQVRLTGRDGKDSFRPARSGIPRPLRNQRQCSAIFR